MSHTSVIDAWQGRPTFAVVDLDALATNVRIMREFIHSEAEFTAVVKANGYGVGAIPMAETALACGASRVAVATVGEGAQLRKAGIEAPIIVMGPVGMAETERAVGMDMSLVISDVPFVNALARVVRMHQRKEPFKVQLKVDTGMRRFGVTPANVVESAQAILAHPELQLEGLMTHIAGADEVDLTSATRQFAVFDECVERLTAAGIDVPVQHVANSATTVQFPDQHRSMVRVGLALHGVPPGPHKPLMPGMKQILTIHSRVTRIVPLEPGDRVSYGGTWEAKERTRGALVPIGYADGYLRSLSSRGWMSVSGHRADVIGRVCMDQTILRLPDDLPAETWQRVVVIGDGSPETDDAPNLEEVSAAAGTIPHEMMTGMAMRMPKLYVRGGLLVAVADLEGYRKL